MKILQWNCLADSLADTKAFPLVNPSHLKWEHRAHLLAENLLKLKCDIYCLQEIDHPEFFQQIFPQYSYVFQKKPQNADGTMIIYKKELKLNDTLIVPYTDKEQQGNQFFIRANFEKFTLFVTHLKAKVEFEQIRKEQLIQLNKYLLDEKIVLCGDFNTQPHLEAVTHFCGISNMISANKFQATTSKNRGKLETNIKDYIFYRGVQLLECQVAEVKLEVQGLPREDFPSDHMYIYGVFDI